MRLRYALGLLTLAACGSDVTLGVVPGETAQPELPPLPARDAGVACASPLRPAPSAEAPTRIAAGGASCTALTGTQSGYFDIVPAEPTKQIHLTVTASTPGGMLNVIVFGAEVPGQGKNGDSLGNGDNISIVPPIQADYLVMLNATGEYVVGITQ